MHKYMPQTLDQLELSQWHWEVKHKTLPLLFARNGVPPAYIYDNANEKIQGKFYQKLKDAACQLKELEPYTLWSNATEREMKELKRGVSHKLL